MLQTTCPPTMGGCVLLCKFKKQTSPSAQVEPVSPKAKAHGSLSICWQKAHCKSSKRTEDSSCKVRIWWDVLTCYSKFPVAASFAAELERSLLGGSGESSITPTPSFPCSVNHRDLSHAVWYWTTLWLTFLALGVLCHNIPSLLGLKTNMPRYKKKDSITLTIQHWHIALVLYGMYYLLLLIKWYQMSHSTLKTTLGKCSQPSLLASLLTYLQVCARGLLSIEIST